METDRLSSINIDMGDDNKGVHWPGFVALGAGTFAIFNFLTRWLLPGGLFACLRRKYIVPYQVRTLPNRWKEQPCSIVL